jgi:hypothetical protein
MLVGAEEHTYPFLSSKPDVDATFENRRYKRNDALNFVHLAARYMNFSEKQILKLPYASSALDFLHDQLLDCFEKIGDIELFHFKKKGSLQHFAFSAHLEYVFETIRRNNINLTHLLAHTMKISFQNCDVLDLENIDVRYAWNIFTRELKDIFDKCLISDKLIEAAPKVVEAVSDSGEKFMTRVNVIAQQYDFSRIDPTEVTKTLLAFLGQLTKNGHITSAKVIHNLFYVLRKIAQSYVVDGGMNEEQIGAIIRVTLRDGLKLSEKICMVDLKEAKPSAMLTELEFISKISEIAMHELFDTMYDKRVYQGKYYYQASHHALVDLELLHLGIPKRKLCNGLIEQMKRLSLKKPAAEDSIEVHRNRLEVEKEKEEEQENASARKVKLEDPSDGICESRRKLFERTNSFDIRTPSMLNGSPDRIIRNGSTYPAPIVPGFSKVRSPRAQSPVNTRGNEIFPRKRSTTQVARSSTANVNAIEESAKQKKIVKKQTPTNKGN